ncbi:MAG: OmpA family protein [Leptospira sp.]|jgi:NitT/TauT family transport system substrate-binding protein|nr:OmpA family protein [Leptospira sp.]
MKKTTLTPFAKILITILIVAGLFFGLRWLAQSDFIGTQSSISLPEGVSKDTKVYNVCVVTWGGYAGGQYFNKDFAANTDSRYYKDYGFLVNFTVIDDFATSRDAFKAGKCQLLWVTVDSFPTEVEALASVEPIFLFQADWSRGGDAIVVREGIKTTNDLKGKKVSVAFGTPSHTFLIWLLKAAGLTTNDIEIVEVPSAIDSATTYKAGAVDAAVVWSPDDEDLVTGVPGSKVLKNTREASHIIADGFLISKPFLEKNRADISNLIRGWLIGAAELNSSEKAKSEAAKILSKGLNQPEDFCLNAINNVRLATYGDNINFFGIDVSYQGVKGDDLYNSMAVEYAKIDLAPKRVPAWRSVIDMSFITDLKLVGNQHAAEQQKVFSSVGGEKAEAFAIKQITVNFPTGSSTLTDDARLLISREFGPIAKAFGNSRVRIEGNTDSVGSRELNIKLSEKRAKAVADFLADRFKFSKSRFTIVGNGPDKPIASNDNDEGRAQNRRTDFELIQ